jgi:hypothetical protein
MSLWIRLRELTRGKFSDFCERSRVMVVAGRMAYVRDIILQLSLAMPKEEVVEEFLIVCTATVSIFPKFL